MITGLLSSNLLMPLLTYIVLPLVGLISVYYFGWRNADRAAKIEQEELRNELEKEINQTEQINQKVEKERHEKVENLRNAANDLNKLLQLWNEGPWGSKSRNSKTDKKRD